MYKTVAIISVLVLSIACAIAWVSASGGYSSGDDESSDDHYESEDHDSRKRWMKSRADITPVRNDAYQSECGDCHFAYQPGLLPDVAWVQVISFLENHYGDDASLDKQTANEIREFLVSNSANNSKLSRSRAFAVASSNTGALPRITQTRYFLHEHDEIPNRVVKNNPDVRSFSNCESCHRNARDGIYNEHQVVIPGFGRWDD